MAHTCDLREDVPDQTRDEENKLYSLEPDQVGSGGYFCGCAVVSQGTLAYAGGRGSRAQLVTKEILVPMSLMVQPRRDAERWRCVDGSGPGYAREYVPDEERDGIACACVR